MTNFTDFVGAHDAAMAQNAFTAAEAAEIHSETRDMTPAFQTAQAGHTAAATPMTGVPGLCIEANVAHQATETAITGSFCKATVDAGPMPGVRAGATPMTGYPGLCIDSEAAEASNAAPSGAYPMCSTGDASASAGTGYINICGWIQAADATEASGTSFSCGFADPAEASSSAGTGYIDICGWIQAADASEASVMTGVMPVCIVENAAEQAAWH